VALGDLLTHARRASASRWALGLALWAGLAVAIGCQKQSSAPPAPLGTGEPGTKCAGAGETVGTAKEQAPDVQCTRGKRELLCYGEWAAHCGPDNALVKLTNCRASGQVCAMHQCTSAKDCQGCQACRPSSVLCGEAGERMVCRNDGSGYDAEESCDESAGQRCSVTSGLCEDLCAAAERDQSYIGCDYWAVATSNALLDFEGQDADGLCQPFSFAVVVANAEGVPATVTVQSPDRPKQTVTVAPSEARRIDLPCAPELKGDPMSPEFSVRTLKAASHITSDVPVTVYQFNPLEFQSTSADGETVYSHTNDSSLLLPTTSLSGNYVVIAQPTRLQKLLFNDKRIEPMLHSAPGFVAVIGVDREPTDVEIISSAYTRPSEDGSIPALAPGDHYTITLAEGEVLQVLSAVPDDCVGKPGDGFRGGSITYCKVPKEYDLTGTQIKTSGKVSVISGHDCVFLPYNRWACDHIEETMFPVESWGKDTLVSISETVACQPTVPNMVRVLSSSDGNTITFTPAVHEPVLLDKGQFVEFEVSKDFRITAADAILVAQFLLGQDYNGMDSSGSFAKGDPSMSLAIPVEQWRKRYPFLIPDTYTDNYVNIIAREHQLVLLDDRVVSGFVPIKGTGNVTARVPLEGGEHLAQSEAEFGIVLYGYAPYTSYMMPGGLGLARINDHLL
jgi:hypothetical protein